MKPKEWNEALNHLDSDLVEEYVVKKDAGKKNRKRIRPYWFAAVAAVLVLAIGVGTLFRGPEVVPLSNLVAGPVYPRMVARPNPDDYSDDEAYYLAYEAWYEAKWQQYDQPVGYADSLTDFFHASMSQFLQGEGNSTYSPVNAYLAMAMLAETTDGNSRRQILDLFGLDTIEQLREQASHVWNAQYCADGQTSLLLANSLWLDEDYAFKKETAQLLADHYYASSFSGDLGTVGMNKQLQTWLNQNTGGLLKEQAEKVELSRDAALALVSTIHFTASWEKEFDETHTKDAVFHSPKADVTVPFMNQTLFSHTCYWGENFTALYLNLTGNNGMWLILPDEGYTVAQILESEEYLQMMHAPGSWENQKTYDIHLRLPKFDVSDQTDLIEGMKAMGLTDVFDPAVADFRPITDTSGLYVGEIDHAARVAIDEKGCVGAAFTVIEIDWGSMPTDSDEIDFVLDRPFVFVVTGRNNLPLFAGVVNEP